MTAGSTIVPYPDQDVDDGGANRVQLLEANPNRLLALIGCLTASAAAARIGDETVDNGIGQPLNATETIGLPMKGEIWACGDGGTTSLTISEILE